MQQGAKGSEVKTLQKWLSDNGYNVGAIDGIYGPKTAAAVRAFQNAKGLDETGVAGPETMAAMGLGGTTAPAENEPSGPRMSLPGSPTLIKTSDGQDALVYLIPDTEGDPLYIGWTSPSPEDTQSFFGPGQPIIYGQFDGDENAIFWAGTTNELGNFTDDPFSTWVDIVTKEAQVQPWILDADYQQAMAEALLEGREMTDTELYKTTWYKTHNEAERAWMILFHSDPTTAEQQLSDSRQQMRDYLIKSGLGTNLPEELINFLADQQTMGHWSQYETSQQIRALADPYSGVQMDPQLAAMINGMNLGDTGVYEDKVRSLINQWLGPMYGNWSEEAIAEVAGHMRLDPNYEQQLVEQLKDQRMAMFPEYTDREMSYQAIAQPWKQYFVGAWGQSADETDPFFIEIVRMNDAAEAGKLLRREGLARGVGKVEMDMEKAILSSTGGSVRRGF